MKNIKIWSVFKLLLILISTLVFFDLSMFFLKLFGLKNGFTQMKNGFFSDFIIVFLYIGYYLGIGYFMLLILIHAMRIKFSIRWPTQLAIHLLLSYTVFFQFYIYKQGNSTEEILLGFLVITLTGVFAVSAYNWSFKEMSKK
jgi:hypothetical protein